VGCTLTSLDKYNGSICVAAAIYDKILHACEQWDCKRRTLPRFSTAKTHSWMKRGTFARSRWNSSDNDKPKTTPKTKENQANIWDWFEIASLTWKSIQIQHHYVQYNTASTKCAKKPWSNVKHYMRGDQKVLQQPTLINKIVKITNFWKNDDSFSVYHIIVTSL